jgi:glycine/D-amino acid oxidase-like deaminating enzyme
MERMDVDVCVVGAGYTGLTTARRLTQAGSRSPSSKRAIASVAASGPFTWRTVRRSIAAVGN